MLIFDQKILEVAIIVLNVLECVLVTQSETVSVKTAFGPPSIIRSVYRWTKTRIRSHDYMI